MATEELIVILDARTAKLDAKLRSTNERLDGLTNKTKKADFQLKKLSKTFSAARASAVGLVAALGARQFVVYADVIQKANSQLKSVTDSTEEFTAIQEELRRISGETRQSISDLTSVYARFKRAGQEAGFTIQETLDLTERLTKAFKIEGNTTAEVNSVLLQLSQSFRSGVIAGEEFRAVSEGSTIVLRALASELGVTTGELKAMAAEGLVTPEALIAGLSGAKEEIDNEFAGLEPTFAEVGTAMGRVFTAAYDDSIAESTSSKLKAILIATASDIERFLTGDETLTESGLENRINEMSVKVLGLKTEFRGLTEEEQGFSFLAERIAIASAELESYQNRLNELQTSEPIDVLVSSGGEDPRLQQERDFAEAVLEIYAGSAESDVERFQQEIEIHKEALDAKLINEREYQQAVNDSAIEFSTKKAKNDKKYSNFEEKSKRKNVSSLLSITSGLVGGNEKIGKAIFLATKALGISDVFVQTQRASARALADLGPIAGAPVAASIQTSGYISMAAIAASAIGSVGGGGGGAISTGSEGPQQQPRQQDFQQETTGLELSNATEGGSTDTVIRFATDTGDSLFDAFAEAMNKGQQEGRFK